MGTDMSKYPLKDEQLARLQLVATKEAADTVTSMSEVYRLARLGLAVLAVGRYDISEASTFYECPELTALANHPAWLKGE